MSNITEERELKRKEHTFSKNYNVAESTANDIKEENDGNDDEQKEKKRKESSQRRRTLGFESNFQKRIIFFIYF